MPSVVVVAADAARCPRPSWHLIDESATSGLPSGGWGFLLSSPRVVGPGLEAVIPLGWVSLG